MLKLFYLLLTIAISFGGNFHIGMVTPRQIVAVCMAFICISHISVIKPYVNKYFTLYLLYLFFVAISSYFDNSIDIFLRNLVAQHFVAIACFGSTIYYFHKMKSFNVILYGFLFCGLLNALVCLLQYIGNPLGYQLGYLFIDPNEIMANRHMEQLMAGVGSGYLLGMRGDAVHNGYFQIIMPFLLTYAYLNSSKNKIYKIIYYVLLAFLFGIIFLIQERSCIIFSVAIFVIYIFKNFLNVSNGRKIVIIFGVVLSALVFYSNIYDFVDSYLQGSRFENHDEDLRESLLINTLTFISNNLLLGGMTSFVEKSGFPPHNIFLNACVEAGIFGLFLAVILYFKQIKIALSITRTNNYYLICCAFLAYTLNSLLHNDSILTGDAVVWILWGMVLVIYRNNNVKKYINE